MATNFPTSLDSLTNPIGTDSMATVSHAGQHTNANDAIEALEAKVGINGSAVNTSFDFKLSTVATGDKAVSLTGTETLTNKTLTAPQINFGSDATGDLIYRNGSGVTSRLAIGTTDQILSVQAGVPAWIANPSATNASYSTKGIVQGLTDEATSGLTIASGVISVNTGTTANKIVKLNGSAQLPAVDGSLLTNLVIPNILLTASDNLKYSADTERTQSSTITYTKHKEIIIRKKGTIRVVFDLRGSDTTYTFYGRIYVNGVAAGTERLKQGAGATSYTTYSEDITIEAYDLVQLYIKNEATGGLTTYCRNFRISYDITNPADGTVNID